MEYMTCGEVAELAHCSIYHVRKAVKLGNLPAYKPSKALLFKRSEVDAWITAQAVNMAKPGSK